MEATGSDGPEGMTESCIAFAGVTQSLILGLLLVHYRYRCSGLGFECRLIFKAILIIYLLLRVDWLYRDRRLWRKQASRAGVAGRLIGRRRIVLFLLLAVLRSLQMKDGNNFLEKRVEQEDHDPNRSPFCDQNLGVSFLLPFMSFIFLTSWSRRD